MIHSFKVRALAMLLALAMILGAVPMTAFADEIDTAGQEQSASTDSTAVPQETVPETTVPEETVPETTVPEETVTIEVQSTTEETSVRAVAVDYDSSVSDGYFNLISLNKYTLAPGAIEKEMILNNAEGSDRKIVHVFEVDPTSESIEIIPGYYGIDQLNPDDLAGDSAIWKAEQLTKTVAYYEDVLGYNVVGAMNTALAYDSNAPYGYMVWEGVVLGTPEIHSGAQTYLAIYQDGTAELRSMSTPLDGNEWTAISANFGWLVKDGALVTTTVERTSSDASRSMIGIKADGTLVFCQVDGRNAPASTGLSNYEMGEMMLALGCVNAVNCDGGGSSTFVSKREGTTENVMRSIPSDGSERATINSVIIVSKTQQTGVFDHANLSADFGYIAPGASMTITASGVDAGGYPAEVPADVTWQLADSTMGTVENGVFTAGSVTGEATVQIVHNGNVVGELVLNIVHPETFGFTAESTVVPYGKSVELVIEAVYGSDSWGVCVDGAYSLTLSDETAAVLEGNVLTAPADESITGVDVTATYLADTTLTDTILVTYGKGSEVLFDFEDGSVEGWMGFQDAKQWSIDNGVENTLVGSAPLAGQFNEQIGSTTFLATRENGGQVKNGDYALAWSLDNTDADFAGWSYNVLFYVGEQIVLRDTANGQNATRLGMWLYIPENAPGLAFQSQLYTDTVACKQAHFTFTTADGTVKNLNSCTEADIPESRWVYVSIDLTAYDYIATPFPEDTTSARSPSIVRTYVKPTEPAVITFYIDDITLDYSDAVEDRVLPTISNVAYATADESVGLEDDAVISGTSIAFSANVADNAGLNNATGAILVDGVAVKTNISGSVMSCDNVVLNPGVHTVTFEIQDKLGNLAKVTRTFTISGDAVVTLSGHNDSGAAAEYDSVYYADINVADIAAIDSVTATLYLQTANTWEPQGIQVAEGFEAEYSHNPISNQLTVTVKRVGESTLTGAQTLVSLPIRVWSWNGVNNVTGEAIAPETHFAGGYCPVVQIRYEIVKGAVTFVEDTDVLGAFGGKQTVATNLNDNVNPWHYHDSELTELNKDATCTEDGYTGRTYCETCQSVVDWGTILEAAGHSYELVDGIMQCACGEKLNGEHEGKFYIDGVIAEGWVENSYYVDGVKLTGIQIIDEYYYDFGEDGICENQMKLSGPFRYDGAIYFAIGGKLVSGWQSTIDGWYYVEETTMTVVTGEYRISGLTYTFDENGLLTSGVWVTTDKGIVYNYGPAIYRRTWQEIDGKTYYFGRDGYMYTGINFVKDNPASVPAWYDFGEDGVVDQNVRWDYEGLYYLGEDLYYILDGYSQGGLQCIDGDYYYFDTGTYIAKRGCTYAIAETNGLTFPNGVAVSKGSYEFDEDGKMVLLNGLVDGYYYEYSQKVPYKGLIYVDGHFYYVNDGGAVIKSRDYFITKTNGLTYRDGTAVSKGTYTFDAEGKMVIRDGLVDGIYYENNVKVSYAGLIQQDGYFYYINDYAKPVANRTYYITKTNGLTYADGTAIVKGSYAFDEEGRMIIRNGLVDGVYYENNVKVPYAGLIEQDGCFYYINDNAKPVAGRTYYITKTNGLTYADGTAIVKGTYTFDEEGRMQIYNGLVNGVYYVNNVKTSYAGLIEQDGYFYYINDNAMPVKDRSYYISRTNGLTFADGTPIPKGVYTFDSEGRMIID